MGLVGSSISGRMFVVGRLVRCMPLDVDMMSSPGRTSMEILDGYLFLFLACFFFLFSNYDLTTTICLTYTTIFSERINT